MFETPDDKDSTVIAAIKGASRSIEVEVYELADPDVIGALENAQKSGVQVRVILNHLDRFKKVANNETFQELKTAGVNVTYSSDNFRFTHAKTILADSGFPDQKLLVMTLNLSPGYMGKGPASKISLNFGVVDTLNSDVEYAAKLFDADWKQESFNATEDGDLVVSPIDSRKRLVTQIKNAKHSVHFFAQELADKEIIQAMVEAAQSGVEVEGLVSNLVTKKNVQPIEDAGGKILYLSKPYEHAKVTIIDGSAVYLGSINYTSTSIDKNREVGIISSDPQVVSAIVGKFDGFWSDGEPLPK